jgi:hypothetical protein
MKSYHSLFIIKPVHEIPLLYQIKPVNTSIIGKETYKNNILHNVEHSENSVNMGVPEKDHALRRSTKEEGSNTGVSEKDHVLKRRATEEGRNKHRNEVINKIHFKKPSYLEANTIISPRAVDHARKCKQKTNTTVLQFTHFCNF